MRVCLCAPMCVSVFSSRSAFWCGAVPPGPVCVSVMACSWLLWYRLGILALMMCKMSKQCLWHLQMAPPWPALPNCWLIHRNGEHFFNWPPFACDPHNTSYCTYYHTYQKYLGWHATPTTSIYNILYRPSTLSCPSMSMMMHTHVHTHTPYTLTPLGLAEAVDESIFQERGSVRQNRCVPPWPCLP